MPKPSFSFNENKFCEYYPCHPDMKVLNCKFCWCPLYHIEDCGGTYTIIPLKYKSIKDCSSCTKNHQEDSINFIMSVLEKIDKKEIQEQ